MLDVEFCVNPVFPSELSARTYDVTVRVTDPRFGPIDAVVAVTLQSGWTWFFFLAAIVTAGLAGAGAVLLAVFQQGVPGRGEWSRAIGVPERFFIGVAVGIGAILGWQVFERTVSGNPSWPGGSGGLLVLILAAGTAGYSISVFVAGIRAGFQGKRPNDAETDSQAQTGDDRSEPKDT